jgi:hypothetical protein
MSVTINHQTNDISATTGSMTIDGAAIPAGGGGGDSIGTVTANDVDLSTGNFFAITAADQTLSFSGSPAVHDFKFQVTGANSTVGFDLSNAVWDGSGFNFSVSGQDGTPQALSFNTDGTRMYIIGDNNNTVYQYSLSTGFDLSTASYNSVSFAVGGQDNSPLDLAFNTDGTKMFIVGILSDSVFQYSLSTGFDLSTASWDGSGYTFSVAGQDNIPLGMGFNTDGTKMYITGNQNNSIYQYSLSTGFDMSTASWDGASYTLSVTGQDGTPLGVVFNTNGTKMFIVGVSSSAIYQYNLSTGFDLSTASYNSVNFSGSSQGSSLSGVNFSDDGGKMYIVSASNDTIFQYSTTGVSAATITYPSSVKFPSGTQPAPPANGEVDTIAIYTIDSGASYYLYLVSDNQS